ncbi:RDD family protein [Candidatus Poriferisodalis sp.]|uniref:RDD family protein n=1 Tax=Candidatus Poriferisodalis sp. TaxID=3101277 RepID=UPI003B0251C1
MADRVAARLVDLILVGVVFALVLLPTLLVLGSFTVLLVGDLGLGGTGSPHADFAEYGMFIAAAALAALGYEPFTLTVKRLTLGKTVTLGKAGRRVEIRLASDCRRPASPRRAAGRFAVSSGTCAAAFGLSLVVGSALGVGLDLWRVVGLLALSSVAVWLSVLLSALLRVDRRGWHDMVAGTVLVSTFVASARPGSGCGPSGGVAHDSGVGR